jgi:hypothetical protein
MNLWRRWESVSAWVKERRTQECHRAIAEESVEEKGERECVGEGEKNTRLAQ